MRAYSLTHLSDPELLRSLASAIAQGCTNTATVLAHIAEFDARRLYLPAAYPSTYAYCVHELHLSEDAANKRIRAARAARQFPAIFEAVAAGRLHLSGVCLLAAYLTPENSENLLAEAAHRTKAEIEELLARRFPRSEAMGLMVALPASPLRADNQLAPGPVNPETPQLAPAQVGPRSKLAPVAAERFKLELTFGRSTRDRLLYAQDLLGHELPSGDVAQVFDRALKSLIAELEKRKFAATRRPRPGRRPSGNPRHIHARETLSRAACGRDSEAGDRGAGPGAGRCRGGDRAAPRARLPRRGSPPRGGSLRGHPRGLARAARAPGPSPTSIRRGRFQHLLRVAPSSWAPFAVHSALGYPRPPCVRRRGR